MHVHLRVNNFSMKVFQSNDRRRSDTHYVCRHGEHGRHSRCIYGCPRPQERYEITVFGATVNVKKEIDWLLHYFHRNAMTEARASQIAEIMQDDGFDIDELQLRLMINRTRDFTGGRLTECASIIHYRPAMTNKTLSSRSRNSKKRHFKDTRHRSDQLIDDVSEAYFPSSNLDLVAKLTGYHDFDPMDGTYC